MDGIAFALILKNNMVAMDIRPIDFLLKSNNISKLMLVFLFQLRDLYCRFPMEERTQKLISQRRPPPFNIFTRTEIVRNEKNIDIYEFCRWPPFSRWLPWGDFLCCHHNIIIACWLCLRQDCCGNTYSSLGTVFECSCFTLLLAMSLIRTALVFN